MKKEQKKRKRRLKRKNIFLTLFFLFLFFVFGYYFYTLPIRTILITGTKHLSDQEIIEVVGIKEYPPLFRVSSYKMRKKILELSYVQDVKIKKDLFGRLTISILEEVPIFYNRNNHKLVFASGKEIESQTLYGVPVLTNYVPDEIYQRMKVEINEMNQDVLEMISEIEYQPWRSDDVMIDDTRFFLRMNDGNVIYVNLINWDKLDTYMTIYSSLGTAKGTLQLDSSLGNGITFTPF